MAIEHDCPSVGETIPAEGSITCPCGCTWTSQRFDRVPPHDRAGHIADERKAELRTRKALNTWLHRKMIREGMRGL